MSKKANLLSIGEVAKYSSASIRSLRYYEQMQILKPAYVDEGSGYRYYSVDQLNHVWMISFCIELGIPLKELAQLMDKHEVLDIRRLLLQGKKLAEDKLRDIERGMRLFDAMEQQMDLAESHDKGQLYTRFVEEKVLFAQPFEKSQATLGQLDVVKGYMDMPFTDDEFELFTEYGVLYEHTTTGVTPYVFVVVPKGLAHRGTKVIPAGQYVCCLDDGRQIDRATEIFKNQLVGQTAFILIETELMGGYYEVDKPFLSEVRVQVSLQSGS